jgi:SulP family sulfate permease
MSNYRTITDEEKGIQRMNSGGSHPYHSSLTPLLDSDTPISGTPILSSITQQSKVPANKSDHATSKSKKSSIIYIIIFGAVNSIMAIPCLFGYAAVIFNNEAFGPYINTLSKVVLWSSMIHQFCFMTFSSLNFAIGQVQDAGLIFLSHMANTMANSIIDEGGTSEEIISTALVILTLATFFTGIVLVLMGKFRLADLVSYLPLPVVGGYLACKLQWRC